MRKLSTLVAGVSLTLTGLYGCVNVDPGDPFESLTLSNNDETTGDGDEDDNKGDGDGDDQPGDGDGTSGDGDGDVECGNVGQVCCEGSTCNNPLTCQPDGKCGLGGGDGDGDGDDSGDGDGDGDPVLPDCLIDDPWCPIAQACTSGMFLSPQDSPLSIYGWCAWDCNPQTMDISMCPDAVAGTQTVCIPTGMPTEGSCALACSPQSDTCPEGAACFELQQGLAICMYDNPNN